jgi:hypothetical protein
LGVELELGGLLKNSVAVSGYRFSDTTNTSESTALLGGWVLTLSSSAIFLANVRPEQLSYGTTP